MILCLFKWQILQCGYIQFVKPFHQCLGDTCDQIQILLGLSFQVQDHNRIMEGSPQQHPAGAHAAKADPDPS